MMNSFVVAGIFDIFLKVQISDITDVIAEDQKSKEELLYLWPGYSPYSWQIIMVDVFKLRLWCRDVPFDKCWS